MVSLLEETGKLHEKQTLQRLEEEKRRDEIRVQRELDSFQKDKLMSVLRGVIDDFNAQSVLGKIKEQAGGTGLSYRFELPYDDKLTLDFFWIDPPLNLPTGQVRFAGILSDSSYAGLNYLLCRSDEADLYGKWVTCKVRYSAFVSKKRLEPFGFNDAREIRNIEVAAHAIHTYVPRFGDDLEDAFLQVALDAIQRRTND